jgi:hypothetical protein
MFLKFFDNFKNKHGILSQKFAAGVTKLLPPDEIRRFDGTPNRLASWADSRAGSPVT